MVWTFRYNAGHWDWTHVHDADAVVAESERAFATMYECTLDAQRHGYSGPTALAPVEKRAKPRRKDHCNAPNNDGGCETKA
jgi:hypothetical protein